MVGALDGAIHFYDSIDNNLSQGSAFSIISDDFLNLSKNMGAYSSFMVNDMDNDGNLDLFIGQDLGGVYHLEHDINGSLGIQENTFEEREMFLYPNPVNDIVNLKTDVVPMEIQLYSSEGKELRKLNITEYSTQLNISELPKGIYFLKSNKFGKLYRIIKN
jgi:hypothetical protein